MEQYKISLKIKAENAADAKALADTLQAAAQIVPYDDIMKLLTKVVNKPAVVKTVLKFV